MVIDKQKALTQIQKLKFHIYTSTVVKKLYCVLGLIRKLFECKDSDVMVKLYTTLVCPIIEYNNSMKTLLCD